MNLVYWFDFFALFALLMYCTFTCGRVFRDLWSFMLLNLFIFFLYFLFGFCFFPLLYSYGLLLLASGWFITIQSQFIISCDLDHIFVSKTSGLKFLCFALLSWFILVHDANLLQWVLFFHIWKCNSLCSFDFFFFLVFPLVLFKILDAVKQSVDSWYDFSTMFLTWLGFSDSRK